MILPTKHIRLSESLFGLGGMLLKIVSEGPKTPDEIWYAFHDYNNKSIFPAYHGFDNVVLTLDYLFLIGAIDINEEGKVYNATS